MFLNLKVLQIDTILTKNLAGTARQASWSVKGETIVEPEDGVKGTGTLLFKLSEYRDKTFIIKITSREYPRQLDFDQKIYLEVRESTVRFCPKIMQF